jgi:hypothetical protein
MWKEQGAFGFLDPAFEEVLCTQQSFVWHCTKDTILLLLKP